LAMSETGLIVADDGRIRSITLDSPAKRNALSPEVLANLLQAINDSKLSSARVVRLDHTGESFSSGLDLRSVLGSKPDLSPLARVLEALQQLRQPVVAVVDGAVRAGGLGILAVCDVVFASPRSHFAFSETKIGAVPALISGPILRRVSPYRIVPYFLTGETFAADVAARLGLVSVVSENPVAEAQRLIETVLSAAPRAVEVTLALLRQDMRGEKPSTESLQHLSEQVFAGDEAQEGIRAVLQGRAPIWRSLPDEVQ